MQNRARGDGQAPDQPIADSAEQNVHDSKAPNFLIQTLTSDSFLEWLCEDTAVGSLSLTPKHHDIMAIIEDRWF
jgi:hypothetical protein